MPTEAEVEAGARVMADLPTIDAPKLPFPCWMGSVRSILEAAEKVRAAATPVASTYVSEPYDWRRDPTKNPGNGY